MKDAFLLLPLASTFVVYPLLAWLALRVAPRRLRAFAFASLNVAGAACLSILSAGKGVRLKLAPELLRVGLAFFAGYLAVVSIHYLSLRRGVRGSPAFRRLSYVLPILLLVLVKYVPPGVSPLEGPLARFGDKHVPELFLGVSYMAFRLTLLVQEVHNGAARMPTLAEYLGFAFFPPALSIGPISPYRDFQRSAEELDRARTPWRRSIMRVVVGLTKYLFLANVVNQLSYAGLIRDGHPHPPIDLVIAAVAYLLYLYANFSGYCDMVIGVSGLLGIEVMENFDSPFRARNLQEFWNRWHISLSAFVRDLMFSPLSRALVRRLGPAWVNHAVAFSIFCVFLAVGIWHGVGLGYLVFGAWHGAGLALVHYYTVALKRRLGKDGYRRYRDHRGIRALAVALTFAYVCAGLFFFANTPSQAVAAWQSIRR